MTIWQDIPVYDYSYDKTDEPKPIPRGKGTPEAYTSMWQKIWLMTNQRLTSTWDALKDYNPCNYYDPIGMIGMDEWAEAIASEMDKRHLPH